jgi:hypothetical protein
MPHLLAKLNNIPFETIKEGLEKEATYHASQGLFLENIWHNVDNKNEVLFLFKIDSIDNTKILIEQLHSEALKENPAVNLPDTTYLN